METLKNIFFVLLIIVGIITLIRILYGLTIEPIFEKKRKQEKLDEIGKALEETFNEALNELIEELKEEKEEKTTKPKRKYTKKTKEDEEK